MSEDTTTINIQVLNKERMMALGKMGDSHNDVLTRLLNLAEDKRIKDIVKEKMES